MFTWIRILLFLLPMGVWAQLQAELQSAINQQDWSLVRSRLSQLDTDNPHDQFQRGLGYKMISLMSGISYPEDSAVRNAAGSFSRISGMGDEDLAAQSHIQLKQLWSLKMNEGAAAYESQNYPDAWSKFLYSSWIQPKDSTAYLYMATVAHQMGDNDRFLQAYSGLVKHYPKPKHVLVLVQMLRSKGKADEALKYIHSLEQVSEELAIQRVEILMDQKKYGEALKGLDELLANSTNPKIWLRKALIYEALEKSTADEGDRTLYSDSARLAYERYLSSEPNDFLGTFNLAIVNHRRANYIYQFLNQADANTYQAQKDDQLKSAELYLKESVVGLTKLRELHPGEIKVLLALESIYTQLQWPESLQEIQTALAAFKK